MDLRLLWIFLPVSIKQERVDRRMEKSGVFVETGCRRLVVDTAVHGDLENNPFRNSQLMEDDECIRDVVRSTETEYRSHTYGK